jgi:hypothetical protein
MYEAGKTTSEVLAAIYGVDLPRETAVIERDYFEGNGFLSVQWNAHPWELMIPLERGGPRFVIGDLACQNEVRAYAQAPHVLIVARLCYPRVPNGFSIIGYDLREVAAGRSTVVALPAGCRLVPESGAEFSPIGSSLLDVFSSAIRNYAESWAERENRESLESRNEAAVQLQGVEALRRELGASV